MNDKLTACIQPVVAMLCISAVVCTAINHGHNGWIAILGCSALSGIAGYNLRPAVAKLGRLIVPTKTEPE